MYAPRFQRAVRTPRPPRTHRFDLFGPKIGRRLTLYGRNPLHLWLRLEADPQVDAYCERPLYIPDLRPPRCVDFWVRTSRDERLCLILRASDEARIARGEKLFFGFETWCKSSAMSLACVRPAELDDPEPLRRNWLTMVRYAAATQDCGHTPRTADILLACHDGIALCELESRFQHFDSIQLRAATFKLILAGELLAPTIAEQLIGPRFRLVSR